MNALKYRSLRFPYKGRQCEDFELNLGVANLTKDLVNNTHCCFPLTVVIDFRMSHLDIAYRYRTDKRQNTYPRVWECGTDNTQGIYH